MIKKALAIALIFVFVVLMSGVSYSQVLLRQVKFIYKDKDSGKILSDEDFNRLRGAYQFHKTMKSKDGGLDTMLISIPNPSFKTVEEIRNEKFAKLKGNKAPEFKSIDIHGNSWNSAELEGKVVVLNFWFVACSPCIAEMPYLNKLVENFQSEEVVFLAFATDTEERVAQFFARKPFDYKLIPNSKPIADQFFVTQYPTHLIIDKQGIVRFNKVGFDEEGILNELSGEIKHLLKE